MRKALVLSLTVGCGPAISIDENGSGTSTTSEPDSGTTTSAADTSSGGESSTGEPFADEDVHGGWLCEGDVEPFFMDIVQYTSPHQLMGSVCASWNDARDPTQWGPCGTLTSHPLGGGVEIWIFAMIEDPEQGLERTVDAVLVYDTTNDRLEGFGAGPSVPPGSQVVCVRIG